MDNADQAVSLAPVISLVQVRGSTLPKVVECLDEGVSEVGKWRVVKERVGRGEELSGGEGCVWI